MRRQMQLYLHIPFCVQKCHYCDFLSAPAPALVQQEYVAQMEKEIRHVSKFFSGYEVVSVFIGGGTPSVLDASLIRRLLSQLSCSFGICPDAEISLECNPGTLDAKKLLQYKNAGVNRLSMGMQTADSRELKLLGRVHTFGQFASNFKLAREIGFTNINVDVMSALPGQDVASYEKTLHKALELRPEHISAYSLIIEEGTPFYDQYGQAQCLREAGKGQHLLPSEEQERRMYALTGELLGQAGYHQYEISNYAQDGFACRHNIGYWTRKEYLGIGLGAASLIGNVRFRNTADLNTYLKSGFPYGQEDTKSCPFPSAGLWYEDVEPISLQGQMEEFMFLGLRMTCGVSGDSFYRQFHIPIEEVYGDVLKQQIGQGLIRKDGQRYCLTRFGIDVSNYVMASYLLGE